MKSSLSRESGVFDLNSQNDLRKQVIEEEFYELLENMMHELNQVKPLVSASRELQTSAPRIDRF